MAHLLVQSSFKWHSWCCRQPLAAVNRCELVSTSAHFPLHSPLFSSCCFPGSILAAKHTNLPLAEKVKVFPAFGFLKQTAQPHNLHEPFRISWDLWWHELKWDWHVAPSSKINRALKHSRLGSPPLCPPQRPAPSFAPFRRQHAAFRGDGAVAGWKAVSNEGRQHAWPLPSSPCTAPALERTGAARSHGPWGHGTWMSSTRGYFGVPGTLTQTYSSGGPSQAWSC